MIDFSSLPPGLIQNTDPAQMQRMLQALGLNTVEEVAQFGQPITAQGAAMGMPQPQQAPPPQAPPPQPPPQPMPQEQPPMPPPQPTPPPGNAQENGADITSAALNSINPNTPLTAQNTLDNT